nr:ferritin-like domain-containing protein [Kitasatospora sp. MAA4]
MPASTVTALQAALAAEHAAVYGYGVIGARIPAGPKRDDARTVYAAHQARRDAWHRILGAGGATPAAAAPGYQLPFAVPDAATAAKLAAYIETRLTGVYGDLVAGTAAPLRISAATALRDSVLQANHWGGASTALPGMPAPASAASSSASPSA